MKEKIILHPVLFTVYPIISLLASNIEEIPIYETFRFIIISVVSALFLVEIVNSVIKNKIRAAFIASSFSILFFTYSHFRTISTPWIILGYSFGRHRFLLPTWGLLLALSIWGALKVRMNVSEVTKTLNLISLFALLFPIYTIIDYQVQLNMVIEAPPVSLNIESLNEQQYSRENRPDIYYIIMDGYGSSDILNELYSLDNSDLISFLETRGFYVADGSHSNYSRTVLSLASSFNLSYMESFAENQDVEDVNDKLLENAIRFSLVRQIVEQNGYKFVSFESGLASQITDSDRFLQPSFEDKPSMVAELIGFEISLNSFESLFFHTSSFKFIKDSFLLPPFEVTEFEKHRERIVFTFEHLADFTQNKGNHFIFAHIVSPHPPFVFDEYGQNIIKMRAFSLADGSSWVNVYGSREEYISGYRNQLIYINTLLKSAIDEIISSSTPQPIIIIQGDHGPGAYLKWDSPENTNMNERMSILNAYYFPQGDDGWLYPSITPVNSFRVVFNIVFGANYELLEDKSYFTTYLLTDFIQEVTDQLE